MNTTCFMTFHFRGGSNRDKLLCVNTTYVQCFIVCFSIISPLFRNQDLYVSSVLLKPICEPNTDISIFYCHHSED